MVGEYFTKLMRWMNGAGVVWIFALTFLICADIVARELFDDPITGVPEIVALSLVACVFLQLAYAIHESRLTRAEILFHRIERSSPAVAQAWAALLAGIGIVLFALTAVGMWPDFVRALMTSEFAGVEGLFKITVWPIKFLIFLGAIVAALECLRQRVAGSRRASQLASAGDPGWRSLVLVVPLLIAVLFAVLWVNAVEPRVIGTLMIVVVLALIALGMSIAMALFLVGFLGIALLRHDFTVATRTLALAAEGTVSDYVFATVPLFVLMGFFVNISDMGRDAFRAAQRIFGWIYGGLGVATVAANAVFAAITGISIASAAIFSKIAVPEMVRHGYTPRFAVGLTAGSSLLGMLIPPSLLLIIYGVIAEQSIGALFVAAVIPGILLAVAFAVGVVLMAWLWPAFVGNVRRTTPIADQPSWGEVFMGLFPVALMIVLVLGGIYGGFFSPTEAGAAGAFAALVLALVKRRLSWPKLWEVMRETGQVSVTILFLITAASTFSRMLTLTELPLDVATFLGNAGLGMFGFLAVYLLIVLALGCVLDSTSTLLILLPLALPVAAALGANLIWFGVITVITVEIGLLTPPFGLSAFVIKSSLDDKSIGLGTIFAGAFPFVLITLAVTILLMAFPVLSLWL
jgi:tripartite ATP-independent transporter DctM subunit